MSGQMANFKVVGKKNVPFSSGDGAKLSSRNSQVTSMPSL